MTATSTLTIAATPLPSTSAHLDALTATGGEGYLILSTIVAKKWRSASFATNQVDDAARWAVEQDERGLNVYVRSTLLNRLLTSAYERGSAVDTGAAVALVVDLDVAGPGHHQSGAGLPLPPDIEVAMTIVAGLPQPSMTIGTGGGVHLWWLLDEPEMDDPVGLIEAWANGIVEAGRLLGWHVDRPDPARVLRVCGTTRRKPGIPPNRVTMVEVAGWPVDGLSVRPWCPTGRFGARELLEALPVPAPPVAPPVPPRPRRTGEIGPADAVARLSWSDILEPCGWSFVGTGRMGHDGPATERWKRPGGATSDHSIACIPDGPAAAFSDACGLPTGRDQKLSKWRVYVALHHEGDEKAAARAVRRSAKGVRS